MATTARAAPRVIITGASSGIGAALARCYARRGATLGLIGRRHSALRQLAADLQVRSAVYAADVRDGAALSAAARHFIEHHGCPDIVIANAGVSLGTVSDFEEDVAAFEEVIAINVLGIVKTFQPFLACMRRQGAGTLVGVASVAGYRGLPGAEAYSASKAAVISYLESLRVELRGSGIKVVTVCPGYVATPMTEHNPFPMPFRMSADAAARKIVALAERGTPFTVIPWQMAIAARVMRLLPNWLYDRLFDRAARKPRRGA